MSPRAARLGAPGIVALLGLALWPAESSAWNPLHRCGDGFYARWLPADLPARYWVNPTGSSAGEATTLEAAQRAFDNWFEPCCSGARAAGAGTTTASPTANGDGLSTIGFSAGSWPPDLGDPATTLAVTIPLVWSDCHIGEADIVFNEYGHDYCFAGCRDRDTAFEPIATHEMGHFFGLGHSEDPTAIMYYRYTGGADGTIRADDVTGICTIYPEDHCGCASPEDCGEGLDCVGGACVPFDPCAAVSCEPAEQCVGGACVPVGECSVCDPCSDGGPCGPNGQCIDRGDGQGRCTQFCGPAGSCPGDSVCFRATGGGSEIFICLNPDAASAGICHDGYECQDCAATGCAASEQCFDGACRPDPTFVVCIATDSDCSGCPEAAEGCVQVRDEGRTVCTVRCVTDRDCGECGACIDTGDPRVRVCVNRDFEEAGTCPEEWTCYPPVVGADGDADQDSDADGDGEGDGEPGGDPAEGGCGCRGPGGAGPAGSGALAALAALAVLGARRGPRRR